MNLFGRKPWHKKHWVSDIATTAMSKRVRKQHRYHHEHLAYDRRLLHATTDKAARRKLERHITWHQHRLFRIHKRYAGQPATPPTPTTPVVPTTPAGFVWDDRPGAPEAAFDFFQHGVASGDPLPTAVVLWTRVTPQQEATPGSGMGADAEVRWQLARDPGFAQVVGGGTFTTRSGRDHTVKLDASGLSPETTYFFRFAFQGPWRRWQFSPTGRTRTAPAEEALPDNLRFGVVSCANLQAGWFSGYRHLAARDDLAAVIHLGDYVYEYGPGGYGYGYDEIDIREHVPAREMATLPDYRQRHAQYKQDADLAALHAKYPFIATWDDHETANDAWEDGAENHQPEEGDWATRSAAARQAYDEWMPVRLEDTAALGEGTTVYRRFRFGELAELTMLDLRTYRSEQVSIGSPQMSDPARTIAGKEQMEFLKAGLGPEAPQWRLVGNPVTIAPLQISGLSGTVKSLLGGLGAGAQIPSTAINPDQWDGYTADRTELFGHILDHGVRDVVFLTGDIHSSWANDLPYPAEDTTLYPLLGGSVAVEFVGPSVTSNNIKDAVPGGGQAGIAAGETAAAAVQALNPHIRYLDFNNHGFMVVDITPARIQTDWWFISDRADPAATIEHARSWAVSTGTGVVHQVTGGPVA